MISSIGETYIEVYSFLKHRLTNLQKFKLALDPAIKSS